MLFNSPEFIVFLLLVYGAYPASGSKTTSC